MMFKFQSRIFFFLTITSDIIIIIIKIIIVLGRSSVLGLGPATTRSSIIDPITDLRHRAPMPDKWKGAT